MVLISMHVSQYFPYIIFPNPQFGVGVDNISRCFDNEFQLANGYNIAAIRELVKFIADDDDFFATDVLFIVTP